MRELELLAPARNADIGIAAIGCGADAVYIAGPEFGARQAAGNSMSDIKRVCDYAHRFGARIFMTLNTIIFDDELPAAERLLKEAKDAGVDAIIAQDPAVWKLTDLPVHASTQCAIRTPEKAKFYESLGSSRLVLEREMSLEQIKAVRESVGCELEFFVHGALCVCYSGQCYMSEQITGRSANRGECIQACRSLYDLVDEKGSVLVRNKALLSLRDYNLISRLGDLAEAGVSSFKIEGRLKNISYVRNVVKAYSDALDDLVARHPEEYRRSSFGHLSGGFTPNLDKTFNRGYTELFLDGERGRWSSMDTPKSMGEEIGVISNVRRLSARPESKSSRHKTFELKTTVQSEITVNLKSAQTVLNNGDGFSFVAKGRSEIIGFRGDVCQGSRITCKDVPELYVGAKLFRNLDCAFEKQVEANLPVRTIPVDVRIIISSRNDENWLTVCAESQDGRTVTFERCAGSEKAGNEERMKSMFSSQISKASGDYSFNLSDLSVKTIDGSVPFLPASFLNGVRRDIAAELDKAPCRCIPLPGRTAGTETEIPFKEINDGVRCSEREICYKANVANQSSRETYISNGAAQVDDAFELSHRPDAELMRTKYCIRYELGLCPVHQHAASTGPLFLLNNGKKYSLKFDCAHCEMTVTAE